MDAPGGDLEEVACLREEADAVAGLEQLQAALGRIEGVLDIVLDTLWRPSLALLHPHRGRLSTVMYRMVFHAPPADGLHSRL
jgi:hypothetical protein